MTLNGCQNGHSSDSPEALTPSEATPLRITIDYADGTRAVADYIDIVAAADCIVKTGRWTERMLIDGMTVIPALMRHMEVITDDTWD
ncbi:MAG: hypothetical protein KJO36_06035 [Acidimicrobiia bacterium]|nr:hypothetical protein [Acidimicrobiia bacterium]